MTPQRLEALLFIQTEKERRGCERCGRHFPFYVLDLAHFDPKKKIRTAGRSNRNNVHSMAGALKLLKISTVLCVVCHRITTYENRDNLFHSPIPHKGHQGRHKPSFYRKMERRRVTALEFIKNAKSNPCVDCKNSYLPIAMDFDHVSHKQINITDLPRKRPTIGKIIKEIAKCDLVCANCHRIRTHLQRFSK
jgi:hypothetical protein